MSQLAGRFIAILFCAGVSLQPALASTVVVPDQVPTVQLAVDSGADTVQIRAGIYSERLVVDHAVVLQGLGSRTRPQLSGMQIYNSNFWETPPLLSVSQIHFSGGVNHTVISVAPRNLQISLSECSLDSGFVQILSTDPDDVASLTLRDCRLLDSSARAYHVLMERDTIDGGVAWRAQQPSIQHCWFRGGSGAAIQLGDAPLAGLTASNQVASYAVGVAVAGGDPYTIADNTISLCGTGIQLTNGNEVTVTGNTILSCGTGIDDQGVYRLALFGNTILGASGPGIQAFASGLNAEQNVIGNSGMEGIVTVYPDVSELRRNTIFHNGGSGIVAKLPGGYAYPVKVEGNIGFANGGWGLAVDDRLGAMMTLGCNDWFENAAGAVAGVAADSTDLSVDPVFCGSDSADVRLDSSSPLLSNPKCGQVGALGVGCGITPTLLQMVTVESVGGSLFVRWRFGSIVAGVTWLERAPGELGPWCRLTAQPTLEGGEYSEVDDNVMPGSTYWYRVGWNAGAGPDSYSAPVSYSVERLSWASRVFPNPSRGPVTIEWTSGAGGDVDVQVFDLAGRVVAVPARGRLDQGKHIAIWDRLGSNGGQVPVGWYVVRVRAGKHAAVHTLLLLR